MLERKLADVALIHQRELGTDRAISLATEADIIVFQRPANEDWLNFIRVCRKHGKYIVSDFDDDPFNTHPLNPFYQYVGTEPVEYKWPDGTKEWLWSEDMISGTGNKIFSIERNIQFRDMFRLNFKKSDLVTCTTDLLRDEFLKLNPNVKVLPNCIDFGFFPIMPEIVKHEIRIGWQGGYSHYEDLYQIIPVIEKILSKHDNVKFVYFGDQRFRGLFKGCDQNKIEWQDWCSHDVYPYKLSMMNLDIGLCPLSDNKFNWTKSAIKWMEYSTVGMATVASNVSPYKDIIKNGETGILCSSNDEWEESISSLILDKQRRILMAKKAFSSVYEEHNLDSKCHLWLEAYQEVLKPKEVFA